jgi:P4 family phage/plasmid primase-like protien
VSRRLHVCLAKAPARTSEEWLPKGLSWAEYKAAVRLTTPGTRKDCGGVFGGLLEGTRKADEFVRSRSVVYLDADRADPWFPEDLEVLLGDHALCWHTTNSHTGAEPRYRVHLPLDRDVTGEEAQRVTLALVEALGPGQFDRTCAQPSRMMFLASEPADGTPYRWGETDSRRPLPADEWLARADDLGVTARVRAAREDRTDLEPVDGEPSDRQRDKAFSILKKACREVAENSEGYGGRNNALMAWLPTLFRLALGGCLDEAEVHDLTWEAACAAPGPDPWTRREHEEVSRHALEYAEEDGGGWPSVALEAEAADDFAPLPLAPPPASADVRDLFSYSPARWTRQGGGLSVEPLARHLAAAMPVGVDALDRRLLTYRGGVWRDGEADVAGAVTVIFGDAWTQAKRNTTTEFLRDSPDTPRLTREPTHPEYVNCLNGMVRWRTGLVEPHDPSFLSTVQLPHEYDPGARCPRFDRFLQEVLPDDAVGFVWEVLGYLVLMGNPLHKSVLLWGEKGRNGKGTLLRVVQALLGDANVSNVDLHALAEDKFKTAEVYGAQANIAGDIDASFMERPALVKGLTGGDRLSADRKYGQPFSFTPWAVPVFSANALFGVNDSSEAFFSRWIVVPFPHSFYGREDAGLTDRLLDPAEVRGVLARAVEALRVLMARGRFEEPESVLQARVEMGRSGDSVRRWLADHAEFDADAWTRNSALWTAYLLAEDGESKLGKHKFFARLAQVGGLVRARRKGVDGFRGLRLREWEDE